MNFLPIFIRVIFDPPMSDPIKKRIVEHKFNGIFVLSGLCKKCGGGSSSNCYCAKKSYYYSLTKKDVENYLNNNFASENYDKIANIVILGNSSSGKTLLANILTEEKRDCCPQTKCTDYGYIKYKNYFVNIKDTKGDIEYRQISMLYVKYIRPTDLCIVVVNIDDRNCDRVINYWKNTLKKNKIIFIGNSVKNNKNSNMVVVSNLCDYETSLKNIGSFKTKTILEKYIDPQI